jgi:hypothetical protein
MPESQGMKNLTRTGGKGAGVTGVDGISLANNGVQVGQSMDEAEGNTFGQLNAADKKVYGVGDDEWVYGARLPERWASVEGVNRVQQLARQYGYARVLTHPDDGMNPLHGSDNVMVALPLAPKMEREERQRAELNRQQADLVETRVGDFNYLEESTSNAVGDPDMVVPFTLAMKDMLRQIAAQNRRNNQSSGMMGLGSGSPTAGGMSLSQAESMYTPEQILAEERRHAGTTTHAPMDDARWAQMKKNMDPASSTQRRSMFNMSGTGFDNPNSALNQARRNNPAARKG